MHPAILLRDPKRVSFGVGELHTRGRWLCPRCFCRVRIVEGTLDAGLGLVLAVSRCSTSGAAPTAVECASPGVIAGVTRDKDTSTSCGSAPTLVDDSPISGDDGASSPDEDAPAPDDDAAAVVEYFSSSRKLFSY